MTGANIKRNISVMALSEYRTGNSFGHVKQKVAKPAELAIHATQFSS
jgi:hypothetical protein